MEVSQAQVSEQGRTVRMELADVCFAIEGRDIIGNLSFVCDRKRVGIVGRNGSGKSTLARLIAGLVAPVSGSIRVGGLNLAKDRRAALAEVGMIFQNPDHQIIFPTVAEELSFGLRQIGFSAVDAQSEVRSVLGKFQVAHWEEAYISNLSAGQKHLVCLMAVVAMMPRLVILDEPFAGLDVPTRMQLERYLAGYDGALLHITHDPRDIAEYDEVVWIDQGKVKDQGPPARILPAYLAEMKKLGERDDISELSG